ncbi:MAG: class I tRNA ligase family protein, partial [Lachnospiraceae bacterium]|nr:class I tRNA ligase family protein [Lachnospiraceae bacterium]
EQDKVNAYMTLYECLVTVSKLSAPMVPFMTEAIYQNIVRSVDPSAPESIHLTSFPEADPSMIDPELEASMDRVLKLVVMGRAARNAANIKNRQPLQKMFVKADFRLEDEAVSIVEDELNLREVVFTEDVRAFTSYSFKPQLRTVGPKYGKLLGRIRMLLNDLEGNSAMDTLKEEGALTFDIDGETVTLTEEDLLIEMTQKTGFVSQNEGDVTIVLDTNLTRELVDEGFVREIISKIQTMRKEADFQVTDHIAITYAASPVLEGIFETYAKAIMADTLGDSVRPGKEGFLKEWSINGESCVIGLTVKN